MAETNETTAGNMVKLREAAINIVKNEEIFFGEDQTTKEEWEKIHSLLNALKAALAGPARNCDVGTAEEQLDRYGLFCQKKCLICENRFSCHICGERYRMKCMMKWAQMPYEEGGAE